MRVLRSLAVIAAAAAIAAGATAAPRARAVARLVGLDGKTVGQATFRQVARGVTIELEARGLPPGAHAVMIHATGACDAAKKFYTAGPDLDSDPPRPHGYLVTGGPRPGDLPNQYAGADEIGRAHV